MIARLENSVQELGAWGPLIFGLVYVAAVVALGAGLCPDPGRGRGLRTGHGDGHGLARVDGRGGGGVPDLPLPRARPGGAKLGADPRFAAIDREISRSGALIVALLRLSPAVPFGLQNYLYGLTGIGFRTYLLTSWIAMLPGTVMYVYLGYLGRAGLDAAGGSGRTRTPLEWALLAVGLAATVAVTLLVTRLARRALQQASLNIPGGPESR